MINFPDVPAANATFTAPNGVEYKWDGVKWEVSGSGSGAQVPIPFIWPGRPAASIVINVPMAMPISIAALLAGTTVYKSTRPTANAVFTLNKVTSAGATTALGTITVTPASVTSATLAGAGGALVAGDTLQMLSPATVDTALADLGITVLAARA